MNTVIPKTDFGVKPGQTTKSSGVSGSIPIGTGVIIGVVKELPEIRVTKRTTDPKPFQNRKQEQSGTSSWPEKNL